MSDIQIEELSFVRGNALVLDRVSLSVASGEIVGLHGANGAGKSTLLRVVVGLAKPTRGCARVQGMSVIEDRRNTSLKIGFVPDRPLTYPKLSAAENLARFGALWGVSRGLVASRSQELLRAADLWSVRDRFAESLSRGMAQRLSLCCALLHAPPVLLLDEPWSGLDVASAEWLSGVLMAHAQQGGCALASSHQSEYLGSVATRLVRLAGGRIAKTDGTDQEAGAAGPVESWRGLLAPQLHKSGML